MFVKMTEMTLSPLKPFTHRGPIPFARFNIHSWFISAAITACGHLSCITKLQFSVYNFYKRFDMQKSCICKGMHEKYETCYTKCIFSTLMSLL